MKYAKLSPKSNSKGLIPGSSSNYKISRKAFEETLILFGSAVQKAVISDLVTRGAYTDSDYLESGPVVDSLVRSFGYNSTCLIIRQVLMRTGSLNPDTYATSPVSKPFTKDPLQNK